MAHLISSSLTTTSTNNSFSQPSVTESDRADPGCSLTETLTIASQLVKLEQAIEALITNLPELTQLQALFERTLTKSSATITLIDHTIKLKMGDVGYSLLTYYQLLDLKTIEQQAQLRLPPYCQLLLVSDLERACYRSLQAIKPFNVTELIAQQEILLSPQLGHLVVELLHKMVVHTQTARFREVIKADQVLAQQLLTRFSDYTQGLFRQYTHLLVVQVELGYQPPSSLNDTIVNSESLIYDKDNLLSLLAMHPVFNQVIGYLWQTAYHATKGIYARLVVFVDGNTAYTTEQIAHNIGKLWQQLTDGKGYCLVHPQAIAEHNKQQLPVDPLDKLYSRDTFKVKQLLNQLVPVMAKPDPCLRLITNLPKINEAGDLASSEEPIEE